MYSNKQITSHIISGVLASFFMTWALLILLILSGRMPQEILSVSSVDTTAWPGQDFTAVETTAWPGQDFTAVETTAMVETTTMAPYGEDETTAVWFSPEENGEDSEEGRIESSAESTVFPYPTAAETSSEEVLMAETTYPAFENSFRAHAVSGNVLPILFAVLLIVSLSFAALYLFRYRKMNPSAGPDTAALLFLLSGLLLFFGKSSLRWLTASGPMQDFRGFSMRLGLALQNAGAYLFLFLVVSTLLYALRETLLYLFQGFQSSALLKERILSALDAAKRGPALHVVIPVIFLSADVFFLTAGIAALILLPQLSRSLILLFVFLLLLMFFNALVLRSGIRGLTKVRDEALEKAVKDERLRVDLIANVSHDLRTPLTSIIGYGNLLQEEKLSENGSENLTLLNQKAAYMKDLVDSVFELTKVSSGVLVSEKTELDLIRLLEQTIAVFEDDLAAAGLSVRRHYCRERLPLVSDGVFLNRVFANLLQNAVKYALSGTRLHLHVTEDADRKTIRVRLSNVSSYEMDFDPSEITERFTRGDTSRTTKGSGLGLAIAKTYTEAVGGHFWIEIDGDVFSAVAELPAL